ncbi:phage baseplate protein [Granulicella sibirica]|uniref:T4 family baseplate hub assembly chaperone n=1 Tax=Granulicella sibirica TaxID=2479048 RepID=UPI001008CB41|nr:phage baseplate protein [Granulicella sibirica]
MDRLPYERALAILESACPELSREQVRELSIGQRDGLLLALQASTFGPELTALSTCPRCRTAVEVAVEVAQLKQAATLSSLSGTESTAIIVRDGREFQVRRPNSSDLAAADGMEPEQAASKILARCVTSEGVRVDATKLSAETVEQLTEKMAALDPQAECVLEVACAACESSWLERLDIVAFLWSELDAWAKRTLREVHALASAYGWTETEVLSLSASRRQVYLAMVNT